jgi:hypothetical protein
MLSKTLKKVLIGAAAVLTVGGATLSAATADAHPGGGWHGGGGWGPGAVFGAGILGVAIGESLSHPYSGPPPGYYAGPGYWADYDGCRAYWRWDARWGRYVRVERCY